MGSAWPPSTGHDTAVLLLTHRWRRAIANRFAKLKRDIGGQADCFLLLHDHDDEISRPWQRFLTGIGALDSLRKFSTEELPRSLGYPYYQGNVTPGSAHFPLLAFSRQAHYRYYWLIEEDVEYLGDWQDFLDRYKAIQVDLLAAHIESHDDCADKSKWLASTSPQNVPLTEAIATDHLRKAFLPILRISATALALVDAAHQQGWRGHVEVLMPTLLKLHGLDILDLDAVKTCYRGYGQSSLRWRPEIALEEFVLRGAAPALYHPVKQDCWFDGDKIVLYLPGLASDQAGNTGR